jgi:hypothetical protein
MRHYAFFVALAVAALLGSGARAGENKPAVVGNIKVLSDKVEDVTTLEDWKKAYIKDGMSEQEKAIAVWKTVVKYRHQSGPPSEHISENVHDPMKTIHVYGHGMCCCASSNIEGLWRYLGGQARGRIINAHSVPEVFYDDAWHLLDASLMNYFVKTDSKIASVDELRHAVRGWFEQNPDKAGMRGNDNKLRAFALNEGWKKGPELLASSQFYDKNGINAAGWHGWPSSMQEYDWSDEKAGVYDYGASMGYQLNIALREGEKLTRNWFNKGLIVPGDPKESFHKGDRGPLGFQTKLGDIAPGRTGNGTLEYAVPLASGAFKGGALTVDNLACTADDKAAPALHVKDAQNPGVLIVRMPCSYVYHTGTIDCKAVVGAGGQISVSISDNNGLDWKPAGDPLTQSGERKLDITKAVYLKYDYRVKFELKGAGTGLDALKFTHDIQHAQTPLPALAEGKNTITFNAGAAEGTITLEGRVDNPDEAKKCGVVAALDYKPKLSGLAPAMLRVGDSGKGEAIWTVDTPGEIVRVRFNSHYRARGPKDGFELHLSFDNGETWKKVDDFGQAQPAANKYGVYDKDISAAKKQVLLKQIFRRQNTTCVFDQRIDVDYKEPAGGFRPVKITYIWEENGQAKQDVHVAKQPQDTYTITCGAKPLMKTIVLEVGND